MRKWIALALLASFAAGSAQAVMPPPPVLSTQTDADGKQLPFGRLPWKPNDTPLGTGPYKAVMFADPSLPAHVIYAPADLAKAGRLPVVVWGNGACINAGNRFRAFLTDLASHGFLVIGSGVMAPASMEVGAQENPRVPQPNDPPPPPRGPNAAPPPPPPTTAAQMTQALDWAVAQNAKAGGRFQNRVAVDRMAAFGQSCGGGQAMAIAGDPRLKALGIFGSGVRMVGGKPDPAGLAAVHTPLMLIHGDKERDVAFKGARATFEAFEAAPVVEAWQEGLHHIGTWGQENGGANGRIGVAWALWRLKGDDQAARMFKGADCELCTSPGWHVNKKKID